MQPTGLNQVLDSVQLQELGAIAGQFALAILTNNDRLTPEFEATGRIIVEASDGETLEVMIANADMTEPYNWLPTNSAEVITFANHVRGLTNQNATLTLTDDPLAVAPAQPAAPALSVNSPTNITASGTAPDDGGSPITSYDWRHKRTADSVWIDRFDQTALSQTFSGLDPDTEYEFQFRATNDEDDSPYSLSATDTTQSPVAVPAFVDDTGDAQSWKQDRAITPITVPAATGNPSPTYAAVGTLTAGIAFNTATRALSGTPTDVGSGTITIRATNSQGTADWTVAYTTTARQTRITVTIGQYRFSAGSHLTWQNRDAPVGLVDVSDLSSDTDPRYLQRLRLWLDGRNGRIYLNTKRQTPDGSHAFDSGDDLNDAWEAYSDAITLSAANGNITLAGPDNSNNPVRDSSETYAWDVTNNDALTAWIASYQALTSAEQDAVTLALDDGTGTALPATRSVAATFPGVGGSITTLVTKVAARLLPAAVAFPGTGGILAAAVTKLPPAGLPVATSFSGAAGSISAAVTKVATRLLPAAASFPGAGGTLAAAVATDVATRLLPAAASFPGAGGTLAAAVFKVASTTTEAIGMAARILDTPGALSLLLSQYQENVPFIGLMRGKLELIREQLSDPLARIETFAGFDKAIGVYVDYIGERLGLPRPAIVGSAADYPVFGFSGSDGVGFGQGRLTSANPLVGPRVPQGDSEYKRLLLLKAGGMFCDMTIPGMNAAVRLAFTSAYYRDGAGAITLYTRESDQVTDLATLLELWPRPVGVGLTIDDSV